MRAVVKVAAAGGRAATEIRDLPIPVAGEGEVLVKVLATAVCGTDRHIYNWDASIHKAVAPPRVYGHEFCGEVAAVGAACPRRDLAVGDYVSCEMHVVCGDCYQCRTGQGHICKNTRILGLHDEGCFAEYVKVPATNVIHLSRQLPLKIGALLDALGNAVHTTQVADLSGKSVAILGFGPIGAMCAAIADVSGATHLVITDVAPNSIRAAETWRDRRAKARVDVYDTSGGDHKSMLAQVRDCTKGGVDVVLELSGAESSINLGLEMVKNGGFLSLLGIPKKNQVTLANYTQNVIFKGVTLRGIIGRQMYGTWFKTLDLLGAGLDVGFVVTQEYNGLEDFHAALELLNTQQALKVVFYPHGAPQPIAVAAGLREEAAG